MQCKEPRLRHPQKFTGDLMEEREESKEMKRIRSIFDSALELSPFEEELYDIEHKELRPLTQISETSDYFVISVDMPCVTKENIDIQCTDDTLTINAKMSKCVRLLNYDRKQVEFEHYRQSIKLPGIIDAEKAKASFRNGVLTIKVPKKIHGSSINIE